MTTFILYNILGLVGPPFSIEEINKAVKAMELIKALGADF